MEEFFIDYEMHHRYADNKNEMQNLIEKGKQKYQILEEKDGLSFCSVTFHAHQNFAVVKDRTRVMYNSENKMKAHEFFHENLQNKENLK